MTVKIDEAMLKRLADGDDAPDFECPRCSGSFFRNYDGVYECKTGDAEMHSRCGWKGPASACLVPSRAVLADEVLALRRALKSALPHVEASTWGPTKEFLDDLRAIAEGTK